MKKNILFHQDNSMYLAKENYVKKRGNMRIHHHDYLTISTLLSGALIEHTPLETKIVKPGDVLIKPSGQIHENIFTQDCTILSFKLFDYKYYHFDWKDWKVIEQSASLKYFINVLHEKNKKNAFIDLKKALIFSSKKENNIKIPDKIKRVKNIIDIHFLETLQISDLAKEVNLNPMYLGQTFIHYYKTDIKSYQQQLRLHFAVSQMCFQNENLTQIAYKTGYSDQSHFSKKFKKSTSISPKKFTSLLDL
jgi:YesN/AraC family two-component response regulator